MSSLRKIVCLANSWKLEERCIAGIDLETGKWVRPVCDNFYPEDGRVPVPVRLINGREPELLDILQIPLANTGNDFGFECENYSILGWPWEYLGRLEPADLFQYCSNSTHILHNSAKFVQVSYLKSIPFERRYTLQLIQAVQFLVERGRKARGVTDWRGSVRSANGQVLKGAKITDPMFVKKLEKGHEPQVPCFVTVSLSLPWSPDSWEGEVPCWKLIAGVIEL